MISLSFVLQILLALDVLDIPFKPVIRLVIALSPRFVKTQLLNCVPPAAEVGQLSSVCL